MICRGNNLALTQCVLWQFSSSAPGPPCLTALLPITLIKLPPSPGQHSHHSPLPTELSSLLLSLHTYTPLKWICRVSDLCLKCVLPFKPPSGACCMCLCVTSPSPCLVQGCFLLASLLHEGWVVLHHLALTRLPTVTAKAAAFLSSHLIVLLSSFLAAEQTRKCKNPGKSQLNQEGTADGAVPALCWQLIESLSPRGSEKKLSERPSFLLARQS